MAAIARMVYSIPTEIPLEAVIILKFYNSQAIQAVMGSLPFQGDYKENRTALRMLFTLFECSNYLCEFINYQMLQLCKDMKRKQLNL